MLTDLTEYLFENHTKENFTDLAMNKLLDMLPEDQRSVELANGILKVLERELIILPNDISVNLLTHVIYKNNEIIQLTPIEIKIIEILVKAEGKIVFYDDIIKEVWKYSYDDQILKVNVSNIRKKIDLPIRSVKGIGYYIEI